MGIIQASSRPVDYFFMIIIPLKFKKYLAKRNRRVNCPDMISIWRVNCVTSSQTKTITSREVNL